ncbi:response regulator [Ensifer sp. HO-A22]|uniref:Response regulator n=1 Tax=Ensifer oleiphilus TaxID=2742698 RepID=A0A7Y6QC19_9HYPH|nr:response regulator [Ensifer oleiphilus]NVD42893.1 response regulator [Ensifer oleiphilus]
MSSEPLIAIVDDDIAVREALVDFVRTCGYSAESFSSAEEYLSSGKHARVSCLLLDIMMPGKSGLELQAELNRSAEVKPIIFISSFDDAKSRATAAEGGAVGFLGKPIDIEALMVLLENLLH